MRLVFARSYCLEQGRVSGLAMESATRSRGWLMLMLMSSFVRGDEVFCI